MPLMLRRRVVVPDVDDAEPAPIGPLAPDVAAFRGSTSGLPSGPLKVVVVVASA
jgi:hypothetical protein